MAQTALSSSPLLVRHVRFCFFAERKRNRKQKDTQREISKKLRRTDIIPPQRKLNCFLGGQIRANSFRFNIGKKISIALNLHFIVILFNSHGGGAPLQSACSFGSLTGNTLTGHTLFAHDQPRSGIFHSGRRELRREQATPGRGKGNISANLRFSSAICNQTITNVFKCDIVYSAD